MRGTRWLLATALFLTAAPIGAVAQEIPSRVESEPVEVALQIDDQDQANRAFLRDFLGRDEVSRAAAIAGVEIEDAYAGVAVMEGDRLANAAQQARVIEERLVADEIVSVRATTLIIILLLIIIILVAAG